MTCPDIRGQRAARVCAVVLAAICGSCAQRSPVEAAGSESSPLSRPVDVAGATVSRAVFSLHPVGVVPFAGPMLPLSSPSGEFLAVPQGAPVPWPAVLAEMGGLGSGGGPGAPTDPLSRIRAYAIKPRAAVEFTWSASLPRGLVLGRSCDDRGFLVEAPQADGSRWIGKVAWSDGRLVWLVQGAEVNAHAALGPGNQLAFTSRPAAGGPADIVVLQDSAVATRIPAPADASFFAPWFAEDGLAALLLSSSGIELVLAPLTPGQPASISDHRLLVTGKPTAGLAYQILASQQLTTGPLQDREGAVFDPSSQRMVPVNAAGRRALDRTSVAAVRTSDPPGDGWLVTTPEGLAFRSVDALANNRQDRVRISDVPFLPRLTTEPGRFLLLGPSRDGVAPSLQILMLNTAPPRPAPSEEPGTGHGL